MIQRSPVRLSASRFRVLLALSMTLLPALAGADPTPGFVEEWSSTTTSWAGGGSPTNPGTGGVLGAGDGYLYISTSFPFHLGTSSGGVEYAGDWIAAGITQVGVWLNDVGADQPLEIHFAIGLAQNNVWQYDVGFLPPENAWGQFVVDLSSPASWTRTQGAGTFQAALQNVDRVVWRHDLAPYSQTPDNILGELGIDHLVLSNGVVGIAPRPALVRAPVELSPPAPNPSRGPVTLVARSAEAAPVRFEVIDVSGRRVRRAELPAAAGARVWMWDGRDDSGALVAAGVYRVRALGPSGGTSRALVRVR